MKRLPMLSAAIALLVALSAAPQVAAVPAGAQTVDVATAWGTSKACLVWTQGGVVQCFASVQAMKAKEAQLRPSRQTAAPASSGLCYSDLQLFSGAYFSGWELDIWDVGYWVNLSTFGFADLTVSFSNGACQSYLAKGTYGGIPWYPNSGPYVAIGNMGPYWNDTIQSIYIA